MTTSPGGVSDVAKIEVAELTLVLPPVSAEVRLLVEPPVVEEPPVWMNSSDPPQLGSQLCVGSMSDEPQAISSRETVTDANLGMNTSLSY
jgi:hypothetical protein